MLQESTTGLLIRLVQSLESAGEAGFDDQIESGKQCLYEMHQMTRPSFNAYKRVSPDDKWPSHLPNTVRFNRAMPHVKAMVKAIRCKDRVTALFSGKAALAEINGAASCVALGSGPVSGTSVAIHVGGSCPPKTESKAPLMARQVGRRKFSRCAPASTGN